MRRSTAIMAMYEPETREGESLQFELCKGGYFSDLEEYGLKVVGKTFQDGTPSPDNPVPIQCVKAGTIITCGDCKIVTPCDLYEGDIWWPASGMVQMNNVVIDLSTLSAPHMFYEMSDGVYSIFYYDIADISLSYLSSFCTHFRNVPLCWTKQISGIYSDHPTWRRKYFNITFKNYEEFAMWLEEQKKRGTPVMLVNKVSESIIAYYAPQPIFAPAGDVNVLQAPVELAGTLSATMPVRRTRT